MPVQIGNQLGGEGFRLDIITALDKCVNIAGDILIQAAQAAGQLIEHRQPDRHARLVFHFAGGQQHLLCTLRAGREYRAVNAPQRADGAVAVKGTLPGLNPARHADTALPDDIQHRTLRDPPSRPGHTCGNVTGLGNRQEGLIGAAGAVNAGQGVTRQIPFDKIIQAGVITLRTGMQGQRGGEGGLLLVNHR